MKTIFEETGGTYQRDEDYLVPNLLPPEAPEHPIGKYGRLCEIYLKEHQPIVYNALFLSGTLWQYLADIDQTCNERMERMVRQMAQQEDVTEALKAASGIEWARRMSAT